jgi:hypothetical protein
VDLGATVVADEQPFEVVQPGEGAFDDPAVEAEAARFAAARPPVGLLHRRNFTPVLFTVVAAVGSDAVGARRGRPTLPRTGGMLDKRDELGDVVAVAAGERPGERDPCCVYEQVMLGAVSGSINRARARRPVASDSRSWRPRRS